MSTKALFVLGILERCGTNYLWDLLRAHRDIAAVQITEDYSVARSQHLMDYSKAVFESWSDVWGIDRNEEKDALLKSIGEGILHFLKSHTEKLNASGKEKHSEFLLLKTPSVIGLNNFFAIFPNAYLIIIIRDGRDVIYSIMKSFGMSFEEALFRWKKGAKIIINYLSEIKKTKFKNQVRLVKYENLFLHTDEEVNRLLAFLELDTNRYDFKDAKTLPVRGSSTFRGNKDNVHWEPVVKNNSFKPIGRWRNWNKFKKQRFNWMAGRFMTQLGYPVEKPYRQYEHPFWTTINLALDCGIQTVLILKILHNVLNGVLENYGQYK